MTCDRISEGQTAPRPLGVFWDIENCNIPRGKSAQAVCEKIRSQEFFSGHSEIQFAVVCDATRESAVVLDDLHKAQVDILHVNSNKKNAADDKLKELMRRFADLHGKLSRIVLISGDIDFAADLADYKRRKQMTVILIHPSNASESLLHAASIRLDFQQLLAGVPLKPATSADGTASSWSALLGGQPATELLLTNLPSRHEIDPAETRTRVAAMAAAYDGHVIELTDQVGSAIVRFGQADQARRFKAQFISFRIGDRKLSVLNHNINYCNNIGYSHYVNNGRYNRGKSPYRYGGNPQNPALFRRPRARSESGGSGGGHYRTASVGQSPLQNRQSSVIHKRSASHDSLCDVVVMDNGDVVGGNAEAVVKQHDLAVVATGSAVASLAINNECKEEPVLPVPTYRATFSPAPALEGVTALTSSQRKLKEEAPTGNMSTDGSTTDDTPARPVVILMYVLNCSLRLTLVEDQVTWELAARGMATGCLVTAATVQQRDVEVRIACACHLQAGRLLDLLQRELRHLALGTSLLVQRYAVRSEFLMSSDRLAYRIVQIMEEPGYARLEFGRLRAEYAKVYGSREGKELELEELRQLGVVQLIEGMTEETSIVWFRPNKNKEKICRIVHELVEASPGGIMPLTADSKPLGLQRENLLVGLIAFRIPPDFMQGMSGEHHYDLAGRPGRLPLQRYAGRPEEMYMGSPCGAFLQAYRFFRLMVDHLHGVLTASGKEEMHFTDFLKAFWACHHVDQPLDGDLVAAHKRQGLHVDDQLIVRITPLYRLAYAIQATIDNFYDSDVYLDYLQLWYNSSCWPQLFRPVGLEELLTHQLSLFFVVESSRYRGNPKVSVRNWDCIAVLSSPSSTCERSAGKLEAASRVTPDIIGHTSSRGGQQQHQDSKPSPDFKPFRIQPLPRLEDRVIGGGVRYGHAFPHSPLARPVRFSDTVLPGSGRVEIKDVEDERGVVNSPRKGEPSRPEFGVQLNPAESSFPAILEQWRRKERSVSGSSESDSGDNRTLDLYSANETLSSDRGSIIDIDETQQQRQQQQQGRYSAPATTRRVSRIAATFQ